MRSYHIFLFVSLLFSASVLYGQNTLSSSAQIDSLVLESNQELTKPVVNFYIENSGSMFGYIPSQTKSDNDFVWAISSLLTNLSVSGFTDINKINKYYLNSKAFKQDDNTASFIKKVTTHNAQTFQGDLGATSMSHIFDLLVSTTGRDTISIVVSDFIISPGKGKNAENVLASEANAITTCINDKLSQSPDFAICAYRLTSRFKGRLYDCLDDSEYIDTVRPYYIWIMGSKQQISRFNQIVKITKANNTNAIINEHIFFGSKNIKSPYYRIIQKTSGQIQPVQKKGQPVNTIKKAKLQNGRFMLAIRVNLKEYSLLGGYLENVENYVIDNDNYSIVSIKKASEDGEYDMKIETTRPLSPANINISLKQTFPEWIKDFSVEECSQVARNLDKTYGVLTIFNAVNKAYNYNVENIFSITLSINK